MDWSHATEEGTMSRPTSGEHYGIDIKRAQIVARRRLGRLPRIGYEVLVASGVRQCTVRDAANRPMRSHFPYLTYLANECGDLRLWTWTSVNAVGENCRSDLWPKPIQSGA